jgi:hypothetical protein
MKTVQVYCERRGAHQELSAELDRMIRYADWIDEAMLTNSKMCIE